MLMSLVALAAAALLSAAIIRAIWPLLQRYALARPNARSSHRVPTPQGAGIAVIAATLLAACATMIVTGAAQLEIPLAVFAATLFIAVTGLADDIKSIAVPFAGPVNDDARATAASLGRASVATVGDSAIEARYVQGGGVAGNVGATRG